MGKLTDRCTIEPCTLQALFMWSGLQTSLKGLCVTLHLAGAVDVSEFVGRAAPAAQHAPQPRGVRCIVSRQVHRQLVPQQLERPYAKARLQLDQCGQAPAAIQFQPVLKAPTSCMFAIMALASVESRAFNERHAASSVQATTQPQPIWTKKRVAHMAYSKSDIGTRGWHAPASPGLARARPRCLHKSSSSRRASQHVGRVTHSAHSPP